MPEYYCDGSGWNGASAAFCVIIGRKTILETFDTERTVNEMEYAAVLRALDIAIPGSTIYTDSALVEGQVMKNWRIRVEKLRPLVEAAKTLVKAKNCTIVWIPREKNRAGWKLEARLRKIHSYTKNSGSPPKKKTKKERSRIYKRI